MSVLTAEKEIAHGIINELEDYNFEKALSYIEFLKAQEKAEEDYDIACFDSRKNEETVPLNIIIENFYKKHDILN